MPKRKKQKSKNHLEVFSEQSTAWIGSSPSLVFHSVLFILFFALGFLGVPWDNVLLILTTAVSLEAIYLAIFIQITVNRNTKSLLEVEEDIDEIAEDVEEIQEDIDEIHDEVDDIHDEGSIKKTSEQSDASLNEIRRILERLEADIQVLKDK
jgi:uncharacterized protein YoxC